MFEVVTISFALVFGLAARQIGLPPLVGFLAAGFGINLLTPTFGLPHYTGEALQHVAHLGVLMLLFTVGLKLRLEQIAQPQVLGGALLHFILSVALLAPVLGLFMATDWNTALLLAIALSFSSTVLAAKLLESKRELGVFHGRTAIGILIVQDIIALIVLAAWSGQTPTIWALSIVALPLLRPVLHRLLSLAGNDELLVLMGMMLSLVIGGAGFGALGLSPEIGALVMGVLLSTHKRAKELGRSLWALKEIFLVGFFLQIGLTGLPDGAAMVFALLAAAALALKGALFFALLIMFRLRARSAFLSALSLTAYSEFGLIVAARVLPEYLVPLAVAMALSFVISAPLNRLAHPLFARFGPPLQKFERNIVHPDEQPKDIGDADVLIFGMGRTGGAAYLSIEQQGLRPLGLDADVYKVQSHHEAGRNVSFADAEDDNFWRNCDLGRLKAVILAIDDIEAKVTAARALRSRGFKGPIVTHALYEAQQAQARDAGADYTYLTMNQAGIRLAEQTADALGAAEGRS
ncbi:MAG: cation:proton antiporter [Pseudomonadota bacterium]|nr:cation:proton antiporter [Pseudomonadota bacterium]